MNNEKRIMERNYPLDFLKILGTIIIFCHHYQQVTEAKFSYVNFCFGKFNFGYVVELFFILSGYFICTYEDKIKAGLEFKPFFLKRVSRLLPVVAVSAIVFNFVNDFYKQVFYIDWYGLPVTLWNTLRTALGITEGWGLPESFVNYPTWYISVLLLCYCIFYLITYISKRCKVPTEYMYIVMMCLGMGALTYGISQTFLNYSTSRGYYSFFFGILLKKYIDKNGISKKLIGVSAVIAVVIPLLIVYCTEYVESNINYVVTFLLYPAIIILFHTKPVKKFFGWKGIGTLSAISYNVYIWHLLLLIVLLAANVKYELHIDYTNRMVMIVGLLVSWVVGTLSHYFIEKPINRYIDNNFFKKKE